MAASPRTSTSSYRLGTGRDFVIEGDEYDSAFFDKTAKFLKYLPDIAVIGNVEYDHADIYPDMESLRIAFRRLVNLVPRNGRLLLGADSEEAAAARGGLARSACETFGLDPDADWRAADIRPEGDRVLFDVTRHGELLGPFDAAAPAACTTSATRSRRWRSAMRSG